jgi:membrane fusion protein (multidrug efflux system)
MNKPAKIAVAVALVAGVGAGVWWWSTRGHESTDDAQVDAHVTPVAARVGGTVVHVTVVDNQQVKAGDVLVELDTRDYQIALDRARAELATAEADAAAANAAVPITTATSKSGVVSAESGVEESQAASDEAQHNLDAMAARLAAAQARLVGDEAKATRDERNADRLKGLLAKDEVSQQQYDAALAQAESAKATVAESRAQIREAELAIQGARSRLSQVKGAQQRAGAELASARTEPNQIAATRARAASAVAKVDQQKAAVARAELDLERATIKAPSDGIVSRKSAEPGQVIQAGQPLMTIVPLDRIWVTANFKETQIDQMRVGQTAEVEVDAYGGQTFKGKVESIAAATGSRFSLLPPENATGNFVKVVQRVPVKIVLDASQDPNRLLRPGMSVTPTVYTR